MQYCDQNDVYMFSQVRAIPFGCLFFRKGFNDIRRCLYQFNQDTITTNRYLLFSIALGMDKDHIVPGRTATNTTGSKPYTLFRHPFHRLGKIIDPQANVIQGWDMNLYFVANCKIVMMREVG